MDAILAIRHHVDKMALNVVVFLAVVVLQRTFATQLRLDGGGFFQYDLGSESSLNPRQTVVKLRFRTIHPTGLLMYSKGEGGDFLRLEILKGRLHYTSYLGGSHERGISSIKYFGKNLNDNKWHNVTLRRDGRKSVLSVDLFSASYIVQEDYKDLNLDGLLFVGGMKPSGYHYYRITGTRDFHGCLEDVTFGEKNLAQSAKEDVNGMTVQGKVIFKCSEKIHRVISLSNPISGVKIIVGKFARKNFFLSTSFQFRTHIKDGLIISQNAVAMKSHLVLSGGVLVYDMREKNTSKAILQLGSDLNDGEWHEVKTFVSDSEISFALDGQLMTKRINHSLSALRFSSKHRLKFLVGRGGREKLNFPGFVGCILNLKIRDYEVTNKDMRKLNRNTFGAMRDFCQLQDFCEPSPCKNEGQCFQDWKRVYCNCDNTQFEGKRCEIPIYKPTCADYKSMGLQMSTFCLLDSQGLGTPYTAFCNVENSTESYTVITHNKMTKNQVGDAKLIGSFFKHDISYTGSAGIPQLRALIRKSEHCRQHIRFHCFKSKLLNSPRGPWHAYWLAHDGKKEHYWGGATPGSNKCACAMEEPSSCDGVEMFCNCDIKDEVWRVDEGYFTDKTTLPVTGLLFNKKSERSYFVLGPLECWGNSHKAETDANRDLTDVLINNRLSKACPTTIQNQSFFPTNAPTPATLETAKAVPADASGNGTGFKKRVNYTSPTENTMVLPNTSRTIFSVENKSKMAESGRETSTIAVQEKGFSTEAIVAISVGLSVIILLFVTFDRMNRKYKNPFPCRAMRAPEIHAET